MSKYIYINGAIKSNPTNQNIGLVPIDEILDFELSGLDGVNNFNMLRDLHAFFGEYQLELNENFSIKPSLRIEFVDKNIEFIKKESNITDGSSVYGQLLIQTEDTLINVKETNYFPDFHLTYNITKKHSIWD